MFGSKADPVYSVNNRLVKMEHFKRSHNVEKFQQKFRIQPIEIFFDMIWRVGATIIIQ